MLMRHASLPVSGCGSENSNMKRTITTLLVAGAVGSAAVLGTAYFGLVNVAPMILTSRLSIRFSPWLATGRLRFERETLKCLT